MSLRIASVAVLALISPRLNRSPKFPLSVNWRVSMMF
ncbi:hypothetical protein EDF81_3016 [Enterobacter sp. BIGb0383]|nr:hypothetical protein EDF81_3016 [Enterobacter sp. BIGb0383]ROS08359.1 hypothetical protein EC848_1820 [Enterobacter sp. BIGb0359]